MPQYHAGRLGTRTQAGYFLLGSLNFFAPWPVGGHDVAHTRLDSGFIVRDPHAFCMRRPPSAKGGDPMDFWEGQAPAWVRSGIKYPACVGTPLVNSAGASDSIAGLGLPWLPIR